MRNVVQFVFVLLTVFLAGCSKSSTDEIVQDDTQIFSLKLNGQSITADITSAQLVKAQSIDRKTVFIVAENAEYKFNLKMISSYNDGADSINLGEYDFANAQTTVYYAEFFVYHKINGNNYSYHFPDMALSNVSSCSSTEKKISGTFRSNLHSVSGQDTYVNGVFIPGTIEINNGIFSNIEYTVTEY
jgi:PBP1b-binding outer membrane lipoprotein LpoB